MGFDSKDKSDTDAAISADESKVAHGSNDVVAADGINEADVQCPAHTTEAKLLWKIDTHVVPFLCIMYLLAFLGELP